MNYNLLLTVDQVAEALQVSTSQVWKMLADGRIVEPVKLGRATRWRRGDIERFVAVGCDMETYRNATAQAVISAATANR